MHRMGYFPVGFIESARSLGLTALLFLGPLFEGGIVEGRGRDWLRLRGLSATISGWIGWRNMVAVWSSLVGPELDADIYFRDQ